MTPPSTTLSATWQLRRVRDQLTAEIAELHHVLGFVEDDAVVSEIWAATAELTKGAARVELALRKMHTRNGA